MRTSSWLVPGHVTSHLLLFLLCLVVRAGKAGSEVGQNAVRELAFRPGLDEMSSLPVHPQESTDLQVLAQGYVFQFK